MIRNYIIALVGVVALGLSGCTPQNTNASGAKKETQQTQMLQDQAATVVGMPAVKQFTEKRQLKMLYELRDRANLVTYSYYVDMAGNLHKVCPGPSVGFGMPFSAQFTAPSVDDPYGGAHGYTTLSKQQPEPNGLYMPDSTSATWVICQINGELKPVYVEPQIIVSLEPMI